MTDPSVNATQRQQSPIYFPVSAIKLVVLSLCSLGIYELYWCYKQWELEKARTGETLRPFWRALFSPLFAYSLFSRIKGFGNRDSSSPVGYSPALLAVAFFLLSASWRLPDPVWLISLLTFLPLLPVRAAVAAINFKHAPDADTNGRFSGANIGLVILGGLVLLLAIVGTFMPVAPE